jgi:hypothetical protein
LASEHEEPDISGESEFSSIAPKRDSRFVRRKFLGRGHFGDFKRYA